MVLSLFVYISIWCNVTLCYVAQNQILLSGDCHPNPGPTYRFPCGVCEKPCRSNQDCIACDSCDQWFHRKCMNMPLEVFKGITQNVSWLCTHCGLPNFSTTLFDTQLSDSIVIENSFSSIGDLSSDSADYSERITSPTSTGNVSSLLSDSFGSPMQASSPRSTRNRQQKTKDSLRVLIMNFQSIKAKKTPFWLLLSESDPDIIIGSETWLRPGIFEREVIPSGYHIVARRDRLDSAHGGVIIIAKESIPATEIAHNTSTELVSASFEIPGNGTLVISAIYRPPSSNLEYTKEICRQLKDLQRRFPKAVFWIAGDANLPDINWDTHEISGSNYHHDINKKFLDMIYNTGCEQIVKFPTRLENTLDVFITNRPSLIQKCKPVPGVSDHDIVFVESSISVGKSKTPPRKIFLWKNINLPALKEDAQQFAGDFTARFNSSTPINNLWQSFKDGCSNLVETHVPSKMSSVRFSQPWINRRVRRLSRRKKRAYQKARKTQSQPDIARFKRLQKETQTQCKTAHDSYVSDLVTGDAKTSKKLWTFVKGKRCDSSGHFSPKERWHSV